MPEVLFGSKLDNTWKTSKGVILTVDNIKLDTGRLSGEGESYER